MTQPSVPHAPYIAVEDYSLSMASPPAPIASSHTTGKIPSNSAASSLKRKRAPKSPKVPAAHTYRMIRGPVEKEATPLTKRAKIIIPPSKTRLLKPSRINVDPLPLSAPSPSSPQEPLPKLTITIPPTRKPSEALLLDTPHSPAASPSQVFPATIGKIKIPPRKSLPLPDQNVRPRVSSLNDSDMEPTSHVSAPSAAPR
ncbi:hypothetical protein M413DRAFT_433039 [Hebeloma cylindrosporum]|uniref:Uncharacterized protein n=1 Tax=Hebeloma cylindrosporum TaxID=76867 RepID=A0A0C2Y212_HEBCY|nr:hypothetical protein M413DRAFT_433039 [Hebeloma cylindrosporum h7]